LTLPIIYYPDPILNQKSVDVELTKENLGEMTLLSIQMIATMKKHNGIGLAAPQIGKNINMFVYNFNGEKVFYNPKIVDASGKSIYTEGCLSIPNYQVSIERPSNIQLLYWDSQFIQKRKWFNNIQARVIQHEIDHLNGILII
jgi:peptide deformylase